MSGNSEFSPDQGTATTESKKEKARLQKALWRQNNSKETNLLIQKRNTIARAKKRSAETSLETQQRLAAARIRAKQRRDAKKSSETQARLAADKLGASESSETKRVQSVHERVWNTFNCSHIITQVSLSFVERIVEGYELEYEWLRGCYVGRRIGSDCSSV